MNPTFVHVLATRVGIGIYDDAWFDYRLRMLESITVPSMAAQTSQDFTWLLVVDQRMPGPARKRLDHAVAPLANAVVVPVEFKTDFRKAVVGWSRRKAVADGADWVMSSRLDDDDALRTDAFERLQQELVDFLKTSRHRYAVLSLNLGCMWVPAWRRGYTRYHDSHSLGLSLVEPTEACQTVYSRPHREIKQQYAPRGTYIRGLDGDRLWWLYATHALADSDRGGRARVDRVLHHRYGYRVDDPLLESFGLDPARVDELGRMDEPTPARPTRFLSLRATDSERQIKEIRARLSGTPGPRVVARGLIRRRLRRLEAERRAAGSGIVHRPPGGSR